MRVDLEAPITVWAMGGVAGSGIAPSAAIVGHIPAHVPFLTVSSVPFGSLTSTVPAGTLALLAKTRRGWPSF